MNNQYLANPVGLSSHFHSSGISSIQSILIKIKSRNYSLDFMSSMIFINLFRESDECLCIFPELATYCNDEDTRYPHSSEEREDNTKTKHESKPLDQ